MDALSDRSRLIEYLYRVAVEPGQYDELMNSWDCVLSDTISGENNHFSDAELERHIARAAHILERLEKAGELPMPLARSIMLDPNPAMLLSADGRIVAANDTAATQLGARTGLSVSRLEYEKDASAPLLLALERHMETPDRRSDCLIGLIKAGSRNGGGPVMLALSAVRCPDRAEIAGLLTTLAPVWNPLLAQALRHHFSLTKAETDVVQGLVTGQTLSQIAAARGRSVHTVRTQMKTILRKTDLDSQLELVRLVGFMERFGGNGHPEDTGADNRPAEDADQPGAITLSTGRRMEYSLLGPADGRPVLFVHGMLDHAGLTARARDYLFRYRIRLIAPARPSFGSSDPDPAGDDAPLRFAGYAEELLDALAIDRLPVIGHMAGSLYAVVLAATLGKRISGILNIAGGVPILSNRQFTAMAPRQRLIALTASHTPHLLPMFLKAGIALIRNGGENAFLNALYKGSPVDHALARQPEIRAILNEGYNFAIAQGFRAFQIDAMQVTRDWSERMEQVTCPVILVHGVHDPVVRIGSVRDFARRCKKCTLVESADSGQLVLARDPALVFDQLQKLVDRPSSPA